MESFKKGSDEFNFMADYYNYCKKFYKISKREEWKACVDEATRIYNKYECKELMFGLFCGFWEYADGSSKKYLEKAKEKLANG